MPISDLFEVRERCAASGSERLDFGVAPRLHEFEGGHTPNLSGSLIDVNTNSLTPLVSGLLSNTLTMDVYGIRRANLLVLEAETQSLKTIAAAMTQVVQRREQSDRAPDYQNVLSQHKGKKPIGAKIARLMEEAMGKPKGWMDTLQASEVEQTMDAKEAAQIALNIPPELREGWLQHGRLLAEKNPKRSQGNPFGDIPKGGRPKRSSGGTQ